MLIHDGILACLQGYFAALPGNGPGKQGFDFVAATVHVVFGDGERERVAEMAVLGKMLRTIETAVAPEENILLLGDFNLPPNRCPWASAGRYKVRFVGASCRAQFRPSAWSSTACFMPKLVC